VIHKKYVGSKAKIIKERRNATQNIASVILISGIFVPRFLSAGNHCGHQLVGEKRCASFEALLRAINLWQNARLKAGSLSSCFSIRGSNATPPQQFAPTGLNQYHLPSGEFAFHSGSLIVYISRSYGNRKFQKLPRVFRSLYRHCFKMAI